jgi:XTP/dITP diphosphohydrolase
MKLYFLTTNKNKQQEAKAFFKQSDAEAHNIEFRVCKHDVQEILDPHLKVVVKQKVLDAYRYLNQPCLVEKSGLYFEGLPELPGPLGRIIWEAVGPRMCDFLRTGDTRLATARAIIGYCDGKRIRLYEGNTNGEIAKKAKGHYNTKNWDPIFIPKGAKQTYAEMGRERKYETSPFIRAWRKFLEDEFPGGAHTQT